MRKKPYLPATLIVGFTLLAVGLSNPAALSQHSASSFVAHQVTDLTLRETSILFEKPFPTFEGGPRTTSEDTVKWDPPRFSERRQERHEMVREQISNRGINDPDVISAMKHVPRHKLVPRSRARNAYKDRPLPIGHGQTISQPFIVAFMTQALNIDSTDKVLEVGTGSGYQAAVLSEITPQVYTIEIIEPLARQARERLHELGYTTIKVKTGDGYYGWQAYAPFDAIIVTAAAGHIPSPLLKQLKPGGTMVIPVGSTYDVQKLMKVRKTKEGAIRTQSLMPVRFVPMTGAIREN